jgi:hypothetical protein
LFIFFTPTRLFFYRKRTKQLSSDEREEIATESNSTLPPESKLHLSERERTRKRRESTLATRESKQAAAVRERKREREERLQNQSAKNCPSFRLDRQ